MKRGWLFWNALSILGPVFKWRWTTLRSAIPVTQQQAQGEGTYAIIKSDLHLYQYVYIRISDSHHLEHTHILLPATNRQIGKKKSFWQETTSADWIEALFSQMWALFPSNGSGLMEYVGFFFQFIFPSAPWIMHAHLRKILSLSQLRNWL